MKTETFKLTPGNLPGHFVSGGRRTEFWFDPHVTLPQKEVDGTLRLPLRTEGMTFITMKDRTQFALQYSEENWRDPLGGMSFFMGDDEETFLTRITPAAFDILKNNGEKAFYYALKPDAIKFMENLYGSINRSSRQGDVHYHPAGMSWYDILQGAEKATHMPPQVQKGSKEIFPNIRHSIFGNRLVGETAIIDKTPLSHIAVAEGLLVAPDHANRIASPGPHVFARGRHLLPPPDIQGVSHRNLLWD